MSVPYHILLKVAYYADRPTREALGIDYDTSVTLRLPPCKLNSQVEFRIYNSELCRYGGGIFWSFNKRVFIHRGLRGDIKDSYGIDDGRYTHYFNYITGETHMYRDHGFKAEDYVSDAIYST